jgi:TonB family protein
VTLDRTTGFSITLACVLHGLLALGLGSLALSSKPVSQVPMLIEVTLLGTGAPQSMSEGIKDTGEVVAPKGDEAGKAPAITPEQIKAWQTERRKQMIRELAQSRNNVKIGVSAKELRQQSAGLAEGRGAGEYGQPGSPNGTLSLSGAIATRGYKEPDFSVLKSLITEETQLRLNLIVSPGGEVRQATLFETSGYPFVDQKAIEMARKITFDPLPTDWKQVEQSGILTIKLKL